MSGVHGLSIRQGGWLADRQETLSSGIPGRKKKKKKKIVIFFWNDFISADSHFLLLLVGIHPPLLTGLWVFFVDYHRMRWEVPIDVQMRAGDAWRHFVREEDSLLMRSQFLLKCKVHRIVWTAIACSEIFSFCSCYSCGFLLLSLNTARRPVDYTLIWPSVEKTVVSLRARSQYL